jgi:hypothetical protein
MGGQSVRHTGQRAPLNAQAGQRRERPEQEGRIDASAIEVLVAIDERNAAERRAGSGCRP